MVVRGWMVEQARRLRSNVLGMAALSARRHNPLLRKFAKRIEDQGKLPEVIITACMRILIVILNEMVKTNSQWNPNSSEKPQNEAEYEHTRWGLQSPFTARRTAGRSLRFFCAACCG